MGSLAGCILLTDGYEKCVIFNQLWPYLAIYFTFNVKSLHVFDSELCMKVISTNETYPGPLSQIHYQYITYYQ